MIISIHRFSYNTLNHLIYLDSNNKNIYYYNEYCNITYLLKKIKDNLLYDDISDLKYDEYWKKNYYPFNTIVKSFEDNNVYISINNFYSELDPYYDIKNWKLFMGKNKFVGVWNKNLYYYKNMQVIYNNYIYIAVSNNKNEIPDSSNKWTIINDLKTNKKLLSLTNEKNKIDGIKEIINDKSSFLAMLKTNNYYNVFLYDKLENRINFNYTTQENSIIKLDNGTIKLFNSGLYRIIYSVSLISYFDDITSFVKYDNEIISQSFNKCKKNNFKRTIFREFYFSKKDSKNKDLQLFICKDMANYKVVKVFNIETWINIKKISNFC